MRYAILAISLALTLGLLDYYVYFNWRRFARYRRWSIRFSARLYGVLLVLMPLTLPAYFYFFRWWEVEPKLVRGAFIGLWAIYYLPKLPVALVLLLKDMARLLSRQFAWLKSQHEPGARQSRSRDEAPPDLTELQTMTRSEFLRRVGWSAASIPFVAVGYGVFRSLYDFEVRHVQVPLARLPAALDGVRIAQISDLHAGSFFSERPVRNVVEILNELRPDLIAFTGDFVNHDAAELRIAVPHLKKLRREIGAFACLGNHDHYAHMPDVVRAAGETPFRLLVNANDALTVDGSRIFVIGTDNTGFNQRYADLPKATDGIPRREEPDLRILLAHDPSYWEQARLMRPDVDLTLAGHTHGGQVGFEFGPLRWSLARIAYDRWAGLYAEARADDGGPQYLYVNRGLGTVGPPIRIGVRPEITVLTLRRSA